MHVRNHILVVSESSLPYHLIYQAVRKLFMRFPSIVRTLFAFTNTTLHRAPPTPFAVGLRPGTALRASMPTIPFIGSLFSTAESRKMSYPLQKSDDEWQAQLSKGKSR